MYGFENSKKILKGTIPTTKEVFEIVLDVWSKDGLSVTCREDKLNTYVELDVTREELNAIKDNLVFTISDEDASYMFDEEDMDNANRVIKIISDNRKLTVAEKVFVVNFIDSIMLSHFSDFCTTIDEVDHYLKNDKLVSLFDKIYDLEDEE